MLIRVKTLILESIELAAHSPDQAFVHLASLFAAISKESAQRPLSSSSTCSGLGLDWAWKLYCLISRLLLTSNLMALPLRWFLSPRKEWSSRTCAHRTCLDLRSFLLLQPWVCNVFFHAGLWAFYGVGWYNHFCLMNMPVRACNPAVLTFRKWWQPVMVPGFASWHQRFRKKIES